MIDKVQDFLNTYVRMKVVLPAYVILAGTVAGVFVTVDELNDTKAEQNQRQIEALCEITEMHRTETRDSFDIVLNIFEPSETIDRINEALDAQRFPPTDCGDL